jgi:hypothetical protein
VVSVTRTHGAPQAAQHPRSELPALMQRAANSGGNVAKWLVFSVFSIYHSHVQRDGSDAEDNACSPGV